MELFVIIGVVILPLLGYGVIRLFEAKIRQFRNAGKIRLVQVDGDAKSCIIGLHKVVRGNEVDIVPLKGTGETMRTIKLHGASCLPRPQVATWIIHRRAGTAFAVPTDAELNAEINTLHGPNAWKLRESNAGDYWFSISRNETRDGLTSNDDGDDWRVKLAPWLAVGIALIIVGIIVIISMLPGGG